MILVIDNYDSFTYNLVQYIGQFTTDIRVYRNDALALEGIRELAAERIVISPGPGHPKEAGISIEVVRRLGATTPLLGVCLGHQAVACAFGGKVIRAPEVVHGKTSSIIHNDDPLFSGIPSPFQATRYHSLIVDGSSLPEELEVTGQTTNGLIMALRHRSHPVVGVQFHPESILTEYGLRIIQNFLEA